MIEFRQKCFTEYDAMKSLYNALQRDYNWKNKLKRIDKSALVPVLKGNNVVIERFVISKTFFGKDKFRLYLKLGSKVKMPDGIALPGRNQSHKLFNTSIGVKGGIPRFKNYSEIVEQKEFGDKDKNNDGGMALSAEAKHYYDVNIETTAPVCDTLKYDMKERSVVLEFNSIQDVVNALDSLPFGLDYNVYILE